MSPRFERLPLGGSCCRESVMKKPPTTVAIFYRAQLLRDALVALLQQDRTIRVSGAVSTLQEAVNLCHAKRPEVVILDLAVQASTAARAVLMLAQAMPRLRVIALTNQRSADFVNAIMRAGAQACLLRSDSRDALFEAIHLLREGETALSPAATDALMSHRPAKRPVQAASPTEDARLTLRQIEVMQLVASGLRTREIAKRLCLSPKTVEKHRGAMMRTLRLQGVAAVTTYALAHGFVQPEEIRRSRS